MNKIRKFRKNITKVRKKNKGEENGWADVFYFAYKENKFSELSALLLESSDAESFSFTCKGETDIFKNSVKEKYGMIKQLDSNISLTEEIFTGITLS